jgi:hypothetical protein
MLASPFVGDIDHESIFGAPLSLSKGADRGLRLLRRKQVFRTRWWIRKGQRSFLDLSIRRG